MQRPIRPVTEVSLNLQITVDPDAWAKFSKRLLRLALNDIRVDFAPQRLCGDEPPFWVRKWRKGYAR